MKMKHTFERQNKKENQMDTSKERKQRSAIHATIARIILVTMVGGLLLSACGADEPQVYRVGILSGTDDFLVIAEGFKAGMAKLGYVEGENIVYDMQQLNADPAGQLQAAEKFVDDKVDLIFSFPTEASVAAKTSVEGTDIPIVFAYAGTEDSTLVESVRNPGGNITGVRYPGPEQINKRVELLLEIVPEVKRIWIGYDKNYPTAAPTLEVLRPLAAANGVTLVEAPVATIDEMAADLAARAESDDLGMDAIILMPDTFNHSPDGWGVISTFAAEHKVPLAGSFLYTVEGGAVFGNANDLFKVGELAAPLADKILRGTSAGEIPVVTPDQDLWINYKVAQELGVEVPESLLGQALEVIR
jgi:putative ABC transport system substrate-binding protein